MRNVNLWVRRASSISLLAACAVLFAAPASATVIDFTGLACQSQFNSAPNAPGFTFSDNWVTECNSDYQAPPTGWNNSAGVSAASGIAGGNTYFDSTGVTMSRATPFDVNGGLASAFLTNSDFDYGTPLSSSTLLIEGYLGGNFVGSIFTDFSASAPGYIALNGTLTNVDLLKFFSSFDQGLSFAGPDYWLLDSLDVTDSETVVPEPASLLLLGTGLTLAAMRRRRSRGRSE